MPPRKHAHLPYLSPVPAAPLTGARGGARRRAPPPTRYRLFLCASEPSYASLRRRGAEPQCRTPLRASLRALPRWPAAPSPRAPRAQPATATCRCAPATLLKAQRRRLPAHSPLCAALRARAEHVRDYQGMWQELGLCRFASAACRREAIGASLATLTLRPDDEPARQVRQRHCCYRCKRLRHSHCRGYGSTAECFVPAVCAGAQPWLTLSQSGTSRRRRGDEWE